MLRKDNLLDEEELRRAEENRESIDERVQRIDKMTETLSVKLARLLGEYGSSTAKIKRRLIQLERREVGGSTAHEPISLTSTTQRNNIS